MRKTRKALPGRLAQAICDFHGQKPMFELEPDLPILTQPPATRVDAAPSVERE